MWLAAAIKSATTIGSQSALRPTYASTASTTVLTLSVCGSHTASIAATTIITSYPTQAITATLQTIIITMIIIVCLVLRLSVSLWSLTYSTTLRSSALTLSSIGYIVVDSKIGGKVVVSI
jgi:hypothetical protein